MLTAILVVQVLMILGLAVAALFFNSYLPTYLSEKARNLATKEDVEEITAKIEGVKTDLRRDAFEHEVRFSKLHERRAEVIAETYKLLVRVNWEAAQLANPFEWAGDRSKREMHGALFDALAQYFRYFDQHRILLPPRLCDSLAGFAQKLRLPALGYGAYLRYEFPNEQTREELEQARQALQTFVETDVVAMRGEIEAEFRTLLGADPR